MAKTTPRITSRPTLVKGTPEWEAAASAFISAAAELDPERDLEGIPAAPSATRGSQPVTPVAVSERVQVLVRLPREQHRRLKMAASAEETSIQSFVEAAIETALSKIAR